MDTAGELLVSLQNQRSITGEVDLDDNNILGLDRGSILAAFSGAIAYLCTQEKMPVMRALSYVVAGAVTAIYVGPAVLEYLTSPTGYNMHLGDKVRYGTIFIIGVGGIWLLHIVVSFLQQVRDKIGGAVDRLMDRVFGSKGDGGQQ